MRRKPRVKVKPRIEVTPIGPPPKIYPIEPPVKKRKRRKHARMSSWGKGPLEY